MASLTCSTCEAHFVGVWHATGRADFVRPALCSAECTFSELGVALQMCSGDVQTPRQLRGAGTLNEVVGFDLSVDARDLEGATAEYALRLTDRSGASFMAVFWCPSCRKLGHSVEPKCECPLCRDHRIFLGHISANSQKITSVDLPYDRTSLALSLQSVSPADERAFIKGLAVEDPLGHFEERLPVLYSQLINGLDDADNGLARWVQDVWPDHAVGRNVLLLFYTPSYHQVVVEAPQMAFQHWCCGIAPAQECCVPSTADGTGDYCPTHQKHTAFKLLPGWRRELGASELMLVRSRVHSWSKPEYIERVYVPEGALPRLEPAGAKFFRWNRGARKYEPAKMPPNAQNMLT